MNATTPSSFPTSHIAVVVLLSKANEASIRTLQECCAVFANGYDTQQVYTMGCDISLSCITSKTLFSSLPRIVQEHQAHPVGDPVHGSLDPTSHQQIKNLLRDCCVRLPRNFTHVLLVDANVGSRTELLQDCLRRSIEIPTCAYYSSERRQQLRRRRWFSRRPRYRKQSQSSSFQEPSSPQRLVVRYPIFYGHTDDSKPNHFLDLWERRTLQTFVEQEFYSRKHHSPHGFFCSLEWALEQSCAEQRQHCRRVSSAANPGTTTTLPPCTTLWEVSFLSSDNESETANLSRPDIDNDFLVAHPVIDAQVCIAVLKNQESTGQQISNICC
eukprot:scaffold4645_cov135-Amphora_coffeaeformis.AAC.2